MDEKTLFRRDTYLEQMIKLRSTDPVKVITGVRRCGKSTLLDLFEAWLLDQGIPRSAIIRMNFEFIEFDLIKNYKDLAAYISGRLRNGAKTWLLLDEVQQVEGWEKAVNSFRAKGGVDIYLTGSTAHMLSSELATLLSGRYIEIKVLPLSFREYLDFSGGGNAEDCFTTYLEYGGFPGLLQLGGDEGLTRSFISGIYNTILVKDVIARNTLRDVDLLERVIRFMTANIGNSVSAKKISDYLSSAGRKTSHETIDNYLSMLEDAYFLYKARRYDIKGKEHLKSQHKYYLVDTGLRYWRLGKKNIDRGSVLENIVYLELLRRGCEVFTGRVPGPGGVPLEVDFIALKNGIKTYYQVTWTMQTAEVRERELKPFGFIRDNYEKIILSLDKTPFTDYEGIKQINLIDFLRGFPDRQTSLFPQKGDLYPGGQIQPVEL
jgi:predicted AAA+ superfamily ATPase